MKNAENIFKGLLKDCDKVLIAKLWDEIVVGYSGSGRFYHTLDHISQMLASTSKHSDKLKDIKNIQFAIFYHDVVYLATKTNNEEKSADFAGHHLKQLGFGKPQIDKCKNYILATKGHSSIEEDEDLNYFLDFDLEKLGAPWPEYYEYTKQIRQEYKVYPKPIYNNGRLKVINYFLSLERIYKTEVFFEIYEEQARDNLRHEMQLL